MSAFYVSFFIEKYRNYYFNEDSTKNCFFLVSMTNPLHSFIILDNRYHILLISIFKKLLLYHCSEKKFILKKVILMAKDQILSAEEVIERVGKYVNEEHAAFVRQAYEYARVAHQDQFRKSGEPYIIHPIQVAGILADLEMDPATVAAGFLHDVVEDTPVTISEISAEFDSEVAMLS